MDDGISYYRSNIHLFVCCQPTITCYASPPIRQVEHLYIINCIKRLVSSWAGRKKA